MAVPAIQASSIDFLKTLAKHNDREWFATNKDQYMQAHTNLINFADGLLTAMNKHDEIETASGKDSLFRIYKDVRFSKEKLPYNTYWSGRFKRATKRLRGGYYYHIEPGNTFVAGGFLGPNTNDMARIRQDIDLNYDDWNNMLANNMLVNTFGNMTGEKVATAPRGYSKDHPAIDLLRYKQFIFRRNFTDEDICSPGFLAELNSTFKKMRPFLNFMSEVLTTDANGLSLL